MRAHPLAFALLLPACTRDFSVFVRGDADVAPHSSYEAPVTLDGCREPTGRPTRMRFGVLKTYSSGDYGCARAGGMLYRLAPDPLLQKLNAAELLRFAVPLGNATSAELFATDEMALCGTDTFYQAIRNYRVPLTEGGQYFFAQLDSSSDGQEAIVVREADCAPASGPWVRVINNTGYPLTGTFQSSERGSTLPISNEVIPPGAALTAARANRGYLLAAGARSWSLGIVVAGTTLSAATADIPLENYRYSWVVDRRDEDFRFWICPEVDGALSSGAARCGVSPER